MTAHDEGAVLVVGPAWIGDMVMTQSLCKVLLSRSGNPPIDILGPAWSLPVVARMPEVRMGIESPFGHGVLALAGRRRLGHALRARHYRRCIVVPRSLKAALVPFFARIPVRTGYASEGRRWLLTDVRTLPADRSRTSTVERYVALGTTPGEPLPAPLPRPVLTPDAVAQRAALDRLGLDCAAPVVAMMPGAEYGPAKQWPVGNFAALARRLRAAGATVWVLGSEKDRAAAAVIARESAATDLCGRTSLGEAIDLIALAQVAVTNDSGLMHIAAATGAHVVALYGSSSPLYTPPLTARADSVWLKIECSPCFDRTCRFGHYRCLRDIDVARVEGLVCAALAGDTLGGDDRHGQGCGSVHGGG